MIVQEFDFEKLIVYQKALDFIHKIFEIYKKIAVGDNFLRFSVVSRHIYTFLYHKKLPREFQYAIGDNLIRAGMSIANNLAEGSGKKFKKEKSRYYYTSLDSTRECISVFNVLMKEKLIEENIYMQMRIDAKEITSMLCGLINSVG